MAKLLLLSLAAICYLSEATAQSLPPFKIEMMADGVYGASNMRTGDHSMILLTSEGVMVVETFSTSHATVLLQEIKKLTSMKIKQVLVTHNHWDHASGTKVFSDNDSETIIICHEEALPAIKANLGKDQQIPDTVWKGIKKTYVWGNMTIEYHYLGMNHASGMTIVMVPEPKIAFIADIVSPGRLIFSVSPDFNLKELERTLKELKENFNFDKVVYAHNTQPENWKGGTKQDLLDFIDYLKDLRAETNKYLFNSSINFMSVAGLVKLPKYKNWTFYNEFLAMNAWRIITDEVMGPYPWRTPYDEKAWAKQTEKCSGILEASKNVNLLLLLLFVAFLKNIFDRL